MADVVGALGAFACSLFAGAAVHINVVEHPAGRVALPKPSETRLVVHPPGSVRRQPRATMRGCTRSRPKATSEC